MKIRQLITEAEKKTDESGNFDQAGSGSGMAGRIYGDLSKIKNHRVS